METKDRSAGWLSGEVGRRGFLVKSGWATAGFTSLGLLGGTASAKETLASLRDDDDRGDKDDKNSDTAQQIFTAALIAEDLATTMYYNSLIGGVIQDPNLAGPGGTLSNPASLATWATCKGRSRRKLRTRTCCAN